MKIAALVAAIIVASLLEGWLELIVQNHPWGVGIGGGVVLLVAGAVVFVFPSGPLVGGLAALGLSWFVALVGGLDARDHELGYYCRYGAQDQKQLDDCMGSVTTDDIGKLDTPAARFAYGEITKCGRGSGPYCPEAARQVVVEYGD
jgi:hypothetical protein